MRNAFVSMLAAGCGLALVGPVLAGGFWIVLGNPDASAAARARNAVITIKAAGCHNPEKAAVTATAIGMENGHRKTIPLKLDTLTEPGMYGVAQQWPSDGRWVLQFVAKEDGRTTSTLVATGPGGVERQNAISAMAEPAPGSVDSLLQSGRPQVAHK